MLWNASAINGYGISASDGYIGTISDLLFDDASWNVRWLIVETGHWLSGRKVLLPTSALTRLDHELKDCSATLTMQQIKDSPDIDTERSVSRQMEAKAYGYYGDSPLWASGYMGGVGFSGSAALLSRIDGAVPMSLEQQHHKELTDAEQSHEDAHLRSVRAVTHYHIHASDGQIGHVEDFILDDADWSIRYLVVDTQNWWPGKKVLISPHSVKEIIWGGRLVNVNVDRQTIKGAPAYDAAMIIDPGYEDAFVKYYGMKLADA